MKLGFFILITSIFSIFFNDIEYSSYMLLLIGGLFSLFAMSITPFQSNISKYIVLLVFWISVVMMPVYHLVESKSILITQEAINEVIDFGAGVFFVTATCFFITSLINKKRSKLEIHYTRCKISKLYIYIFLITLYFLTAFCYSIGLGRMGSEAVVLPFHIGGVLNLFRNTFAPIMFAIVIENFILRKERIPRKIILLYFVWVIMEVIAWMSKGAIIVYFLPIGFVYYLYYKPSVIKIIKYVSPILVVFLFLYPVMGTMRHMDKQESIIKNYQETKIEVDKFKKNKGIDLTPLNRTFMTAGQYCLAQSLVESKDLFDFSKAETIFLMGGAARYQTYIIENYPTWVVHSSGTTGLMDSLLHGGKGLVYVVIILLIILASLFDRVYFKKMYSIYMIFILIILSLTQDSSVSVFYSPLGLQKMFVQGVCMLFAKKFNFINI